MVKLGWPLSSRLISVDKYLCGVRTAQLVSVCTSSRLDCAPNIGLPWSDKK